MTIKRLTLLSLVLVASCKPPTPSEQMNSILSWIGTVGMAGDAWLRHTTRDAYTRETLDLSSKTLSEISNDLLKSLPAAIDSAALDSVLIGSAHRIGRMARMIEAKNAPGFAQELDGLHADQKVVKAFADRIESKQ